MRRRSLGFLFVLLTILLGVAAPLRVAAVETRPRLVFLNGNGARITPGATDDSSAQVASQIPPSAPKDARGRVRYFAYHKSDWSSVVQCVKARFSSWDITFVDEAPGATVSADPGATPHIEVVVTGREATEIGFPAGVGGVTQPFFSCAPDDDIPPVNEKAVAFVFARTYDNPLSQGDVCHSIAHEIGHALGLEHSSLCAEGAATEIMDRFGCSATSEFTDVTGRCQSSNGSARDCICTGTQNSFQRLSRVLGIKGGNPPEITLVEPVAKQLVTIGAPLTVRAVIRRGAADVNPSTVALKWLDTGASFPLALVDATTGTWGATIMVPQTHTGKNKVQVVATDVQGRAGASDKRKVKVTAAGGSVGADCVSLCGEETCGTDYYCGGSCQPASGCCTPQCSGVACGLPDGCGGTCGAGSGCVACSPSCAGVECGDSNGCGGVCQAGSGCAFCNHSCSGIICGGTNGCGEPCGAGSGCLPATCWDKWCGDGACQADCGETQSTCSLDCHPACQPSCLGVLCGNGDGCGAKCLYGSSSCTSGCAPDCSSVSCGEPDPSCGEICRLGSGCF